MLNLVCFLASSQDNKGRSLVTQSQIPFPVVLFLGKWLTEDM